MFPTEIYHYILSFSDGFERENMKLVCKEWNNFRFNIEIEDPFRDREVSYIKGNLFYNLFKYGHEDLIEVYIDRHDIMWYETIYSLACFYGMERLVKRCIDCGINEWSIGAHNASLGGHIELVKMLVRLSRGNIQYDYVLQAAVISNNSEIIEYLLNFTRIDTLLYYAGIFCNIDVIDKYLTLVRENILDEMLICSCKYGRMDLIETLIKLGARDFDGGFDMACRSGYLDIAKYMIGKGAQPDDVIDSFEIACIDGHYDMVKYMIENDYNPYDWNVIFNLCSRCTNLELINYVTLHYEARTMEDVEDAFRSACFEGNIETVKYYISLGAREWNDGLANSARVGDMEIVKLMLSKGANDFNRALIEAATGGYINIVKLMISLGANKWDEAMIAARNNGNENIARLMIKYGAKDNGEYPDPMDYYYGCSRINVLEF